jgi:hypothetical protein
MKNILPLVLLSAAGNAALAADADLAKRVEALEMASYTNTVSLSGFLETRFEEGTLKPQTGDKVTRSINTMIGGIDFKANPSDRVSIFGRFVYSTAYNANQSAPDTESSTWSDGRAYTDSKAYFERFFANIKLIDNLQFTFGRLPTVDGPPYHFLDSLSRQGSYPKWIYPAAVDGYALTYSYPFSQGHSLAARAIHSPMTFLTYDSGITADFKFKKPNTTGVDTSGTPVTAPYRDKVDIKSVMLDYNNATTSFTKDLNVIVQTLAFDGFQLGPLLTASYSHQLVYAEMNQIMSTGLNLWLAYSMTEIKSDGYIGVPVPAAGIVVPLSTMANGPDGSAKGKGTALGVNYTLPIEAMNNPGIGAEYINNDEKYVLFELTQRQMFNIYGIHGKATHLYWSQPLAAGVKLRVGTMLLNPTHNWGYVGAPVETKNEYSSVYANLRLDF